MTDSEWVEVCPNVAYKFHGSLLTVRATLEGDTPNDIMGRGGRIYQTFPSGIVEKMERIWDLVQDKRTDFRNDMIHAIGHALLAQSALNVYAVVSAVDAGSTPLLPLRMVSESCIGMMDLIKITTAHTAASHSFHNHTEGMERLKKLMGEQPDRFRN